MKGMRFFRLAKRNIGSADDSATSFSLARYSKLNKNEQEILGRLREEFNDQFTSLDDKQAKQLSSETKEMINFVQSRVGEWLENRSGSVQISLGMFAFSVAGLGLISDPSKTPWYVYPIALPFLGGLLITSLAQFIAISKQISFHYPFIDASHTWRWFYLYSVPSNMPLKIRLSEHERSNSRQLFLKGLIQYAKNTIQLDAKLELRQNLEQLYLLLVYEGYLVRFTITTNNILRIGVIISMVTSTALGLGLLLYETLLKVS